MTTTKTGNKGKGKGKAVAARKPKGNIFADIMAKPTAKQAEVSRKAANDKAMADKKANMRPAFKSATGYTLIEASTGRKSQAAGAAYTVAALMLLNAIRPNRAGEFTNTGHHANRDDVVTLCGGSMATHWITTGLAKMDGGKFHVVPSTTLHTVLTRYKPTDGRLLVNIAVS